MDFKKALALNLTFFIHMCNIFTPALSKKMRKGLFFLFFVPFLLAAQENSGWQKVSTDLLTRYSATERLPVIIRFHDLNLDLSAWDVRWTKEQKGMYIFSALARNANRSQQSTLDWLRRQGLPFQRNLLVNALLADLTREQVGSLSRRTEIAALMYNPEMAQLPPFRQLASSPLRGAAEWGLVKMGVPAVWAMGYRGQGVVVAGQDTGYDWTHPDLVSSYRGNSQEGIRHDYHWFDAISKPSPLNSDTLNPCGYQLRRPCDDDAHGTHTLGTMVGQDSSGTAIGVAPSARWIGARNMERGYGNPFSYLSCFDWFLAPRDLSGKNPEPRLAPHVINNSWSCPGMEGCGAEHVELYEKALSLLRKAGIVVVVSAGNGGPTCETLREIPVNLSSAFSVAATRSDDTIASFSSRGPAFISGKKQVKPDVSAPGVSIRSAIPDRKYGLSSGTSMAGPHVAGLVALLLSANPALAGQVDRIEQIIRETALPIYSRQACNEFSGSSRPNPVYGYGRIDALAAVRRALGVTALRDEFELPLRIYPNATHKLLLLEADAPLEGLTFRLTDLLGRSLLNDPVISDQIQIPLPSLPAGMYVYTLFKQGQMKSGLIFLDQQR